MKADILTLKAMFQKDVRYIIPTFQRPYVWNQEDQWEPLWNDVRNTAEEYLDELAKDGSHASAEERAGSHFLGAVVLQQQQTATAELETRHVIDGQQRLTTLQLLLDAAQEVFEQDGYEKESKQLRKLVVNDEDYAEGDATNVFKVWPTLTDREPFRHAMDNALAIVDFEDAPIVQAHEFFKLQIRQWMEGQSEERAAALVTALIGLLQMVVIDLSTTDDANIIFETLNARGTPLLASDLIKNSVLYMAQETGFDSDAVYEQYWKGFDNTLWREEVRQGRIVRPRIDVYLNYWLTMRTGEEVQSSDVFPRFRRYSDDLAVPVTHIVEDIAATANAYRQLDTLDDDSAYGTFLYRWRILDAGVVTPIILWLFAEANNTSPAEVQRALGTIESYLVRRMVCRLTTKGYNRLFLDLLVAMKDAGALNAADAIAAFFVDQTADSAFWPSDLQIENAFVSLPLYQLLTRRRLRMILEAMEDTLRTPKTEEPHVPRNKLTIEHVMPQAWRAHWPLPVDSAIDAAQARDRLVQTIGNLTLVTDRLNPTLSNAPWTSSTVACKRDLMRNSVLLLNKELMASAPEQWSEDAIDARSRTLARLACSIWPRP